MGKHHNYCQKKRNEPGSILGLGLPKFIKSWGGERDCDTETNSLAALIPANNKHVSHTIRGCGAAGSLYQLILFASKFDFG